MVRGLFVVEDGDVVDIRDTSPTRWARWQSWQAVLAAGVLVLAGSTTTVILQSSDPASANTYVSSFREAQVYLPDGTNHPAVEGERLVKGAELHTGSQGGARLTTGGRTVYVGGLTTIKVLDGVHQVLSGNQDVGAGALHPGGVAMVDARHGARLTLDTTAGAVKVADGALARVEEGALYLRLGVYDGTSTVTATGRSATAVVRRYFQVQVNTGSVPGAVQALHLSNDAWDQALAADLVNNDRDLNTIAESLGGSYGEKVYSVAPVSLRTGSVTAAGSGRAQDALSLLIAQASHSKDPQAKVLDDVRSYYAGGGSWGVIAALENARVSTVSSLLSAALAPPPPGGPSTAVAGGTPPTGLVTATPTSKPGPTPTTPASPSTSRPTVKPTHGPSSGPTSPPPTSPPPGLVGSLVDTLLNVIAPSPKAVAPAGPTPATSPCLLGLLGC